MNRKVAVIGAALDLGQQRRGVDMGPSAIRYAGLAGALEALGCEWADLGNVAAAVAETVEEQDERARYLDEVRETCARIAELVEGAALDGATPLVLGGDHSIALGTLAGLAAVHGPGGVLWIDAHADLNTPATTLTGNIHGMVLAGALGLWYRDEPVVDPERVAIVGLRAVDDAERDVIRSRGITVATMSDVDRRGIQTVMSEALERVGGPGFVHVSFDADAVDPDVAPGVGTPVRGGLSYREAHLAMELISESGVATSFEAVEVNPILDRRNVTARLVVELLASALGEKIL